MIPLRHSRVPVSAVLLAGALACVGAFAQSNPSTAAAAAPLMLAAAAPVSPPQRTFAETDLVQLLTTTLQRDYVKDSGELEIRLTQPWKTRNVPNEPLTLVVLDMPTLGVTPNFVVRFELRAAQASLGTWEIPVKAHVWRETWVARSPLPRGLRVADADIDRERRDMLTLHEPLAAFSAGDPALELAESVSTGMPLLARAVHLRAVVHRGQAIDAFMQDGVLSITLKVEALEDGAPGQFIRVRNVQTRRDLLGKVLNEQTILLAP